jgi:hypothetical protein
MNWLALAVAAGGAYALGRTQGATSARAECQTGQRTENAPRSVARSLLQARDAITRAEPLLRPLAEGRRVPVSAVVSLLR